MRSIATALLAMTCATPVVAMEYRYSETPRGFVPYAINDSGAMAGTLYVNTAALLRNGIVESIADFLTPSGINNLGTVVLWKSAGSYSFDGHVLAEISIPDSKYVTAEDINDHGMIVGYYLDSGPPTTPWTPHAFVVLDGRIDSLDHPDFDGVSLHGTYFFGNNNKGQVVGVYAGANGLQGFVYQDGVFTPITHERPQDINDHGQIVGIADNGGGFLDSGGEMISIEFPGALITSPRSINNLGQIVGFYQRAGDFARYGFIASPVVPAWVSLDPRNLPPRGGGVLIATVELPAGYATSEITRAAIEEINGQSIAPIYPIEAHEANDHDEDGIDHVTFKFDAEDLTPRLNPGWNSISLSGEMVNGVFFKGIAPIFVEGRR